MRKALIVFTALCVLNGTSAQASAPLLEVNGRVCDGAIFTDHGDVYAALEVVGPLLMGPQFHLDNFDFILRRCTFSFIAAGSTASSRVAVLGCLKRGSDVYVPLKQLMHVIGGSLTVSSGAVQLAYPRDAHSAPGPAAVATPAPGPAAVATPAPGPVAVATPAPGPVEVATPAPGPVAVATPAPGPVEVATPAPGPVAVATPVPSPVAIATPVPSPVAIATPVPSPVAVATPAPTPATVATSPTGARSPRSQGEPASSAIVFAAVRTANQSALSPTGLIQRVEVYHPGLSEPSDVIPNTEVAGLKVYVKKLSSSDTVDVLMWAGRRPGGAPAFRTRLSRFRGNDLEESSFFVRLPLTFAAGWHTVRLEYNQTESVEYHFVTY